MPLKYEGLSATEVWISEAQERMVLAVAPGDWEKLARIAADEGVEATAIGTFTGDGRIELKWQEEVAGVLDCHFLHEGRPRQRLQSRYVPLPATSPAWSATTPSLGATLLEILAAPDVASKEWIIRQYDHEVQGCSVIKPLLGPGEGPADATVVRGVLGRDRGIALGVGLRHRIGPLDPWQMAAGGIVEAVANVVATGADPDRIALLDNFCWGDTRRPESLGTLVEACRACHDVAVDLGAPFVSGKDSLNNVFAWTDAAGKPRELSIPPTLLATAMGQVDDVRRVVTPDLKRPGSRLAVIGLTRDDLAGSQLEALGVVTGGAVPRIDAPSCRKTFRHLAHAIRDGGILACHDVSDGGLLAAVAEMAIGGAIGATIDLGKVPTLLEGGQGRHADLTIAFAESPCRFVCEVDAESAGRMGEWLEGIPWGWIGDVVYAPRLTVTGCFDGDESVALDALARAWRSRKTSP